MSRVLRVKRRRHEDPEPILLVEEVQNRPPAKKRRNMDRLISSMESKLSVTHQKSDDDHSVKSEWKVFELVETRVDDSLEEKVLEKVINEKRVEGEAIETAKRKCHNGTMERRNRLVEKKRFHTNSQMEVVDFEHEEENADDDTVYDVYCLCHEKKDVLRVTSDESSGHVGKLCFDGGEDMNMDSFPIVQLKLHSDEYISENYDDDELTDESLHELSDYPSDEYENSDDEDTDSDEDRPERLHMSEFRDYAYYDDDFL